MLSSSGNASSESRESTSITLLERVKQRQPEAWRRFAALYGPVVYSWALRTGLQPDDAADITQEVFQAVVQHIDRFQRKPGGDSLRGWLWTVTRNKVRDRFRLRQEEPAATGGTDAHQLLLQIPSMPELNDEPAGTVTCDLAHRALQLIQNEFEGNTWKAFRGIAVEGQSTADVAQDLGLTLAATYKAKSRVLNRLRQELDGLLD